MNLRSRIFWQLVSLAIMFCIAGMAINVAQHAAERHVQIFPSLWFPFFVGCFVIEVAALAFLFILWFPAGQKLIAAFEKISNLRSGWRIVGAIGLIGMSAIYTLVIIQPVYGQKLDGDWTRAALFLFLSLAGMFILKLGRKGLGWLYALGWSALLQAVLYSVITRFSQVNNYPFSQSWSEYSHYYGASLYFAERLYGMRLPLPVLNPAYHLMLTVPFWFGVPPIWIQRLWDILLQAGLTAGLAMLFSARLKLQQRALFWYVVGWAFLFLMQGGPIYAPQLLCVLFVLAGVAPGKFWRSTIIVFLVSLWAGWCRINWFPVPAALAALLYFLEIPITISKRWLAYLWKPALWIMLGTASAFASNRVYMIISGNGSGWNFASSLTSDLLWYRLLPNATYAPGILFMICVASLPLWLVVVSGLRTGKDKLHILRLAGIFAVFGAFFLGGLLVSVKIGGGRDLHNLDAYLIMLMLVGASFFSGQFQPDHPEAGTFPLTKTGIAVLLVIMPIWFAIQASPAFRHWDNNQAGQALSQIREDTARVTARGGEVLFMSQRHLLTFGEVQVPLVAEYDQVTVMEMVMSHNQAYLDTFQNDLRTQRFGMIVLDLQKIQYFGRSRNFGEENDYWVEAVSTPLLCYYQPVSYFPDFSVTIYEPSDHPCK